MKTYPIHLMVEIVNNDTDELFDRKPFVYDISEKEIKETARIMDENGGFPVEFHVLQSVWNNIGEEACFFYDDNFAPADEDFWNIYTFEIGEDMPEDLVKLAEQYVTRKTVDIVFYAKDGKGEAISCDLRPATYWTMIEAAKTNDGSKTDFEHLEETHPEAFEEVKNLVLGRLKETGKEVEGFHLKEFPYQVLENAM